MFGNPSMHNGDSDNDEDSDASSVAPPDSDDERLMAAERESERECKRSREIALTQPLPAAADDEQEVPDDVDVDMDCAAAPGPAPQNRKRASPQQQQRNVRPRRSMGGDSPMVRAHARSMSMPQLALDEKKQDDDEDNMPHSQPAHRRSQSSQSVRRRQEQRDEDDDEENINDQRGNPDAIPDDMIHYVPRTVPAEMIRYYGGEDAVLGGTWKYVVKILAQRRDARAEDFVQFYQRQIQELEAVFASPVSSDVHNPDRALAYFEKLADVLFHVIGGSVNITHALFAVELANRVLGPCHGSYMKCDADIPCSLLKQYAASMLSRFEDLRHSKAMRQRHRGQVPDKARLDGIAYKIWLFASRIDQLRELRRAMCDLFRTTSPDFNVLCLPMDTAGCCTAVDISTLKDFQKALVLTMQRARRMNLRRIGKVLFEPHYITDKGGHVTPTHFYQRRCEIEQFVGELCNYQTSSDFRDIMQPQNKSSIPNWAEVCTTSDLPVLVRDRHAFSFPNGLFVGLDSKSPPRHRFYSYNDPDIARCPSISCNYLEHQEVDPKWCELPYNFFPGGGRCKHDADILGGLEDEDWMTAIPTPTMDKLFLFQWPEEPEEQVKLTSACRTIDPKVLRRFMYAMLGRLMFDVNELDRWAVFPIIIGRAQTGKSLLADKLFGGAIYQTTDVHCVSNNSEATFGLAPMYNKFLWYISEFRRKDNRQGGMSQSDFLVIVEGGNVEIREKYKTAMNVIWTPPGFGVGNEMNEWADKKDSLVRRLFLVHFNRQTPPNMRDDNLVDSLTKTEIAANIVKCTHAYLSLLQYMRDFHITSLQAILPEQVKRNLELFKITSDISSDFMADPDNGIVVDRENADAKNPVLYVPWSRFFEQFRTWLAAKKKLNISHPTTPELWQALLIQNNIEFSPDVVNRAKEKRLYPRSNKQNHFEDTLFLVNVDIEFNCTEAEKDLFRNNKNDSVLPPPPPPSQQQQQPRNQRVRDIGDDGDDVEQKQPSPSMRAHKPRARRKPEERTYGAVVHLVDEQMKKFKTLPTQSRFRNRGQALTQVEHAALAKARNAMMDFVEVESDHLRQIEEVHAQFRAKFHIEDLPETTEKEEDEMRLETFYKLLEFMKKCVDDDEFKEFESDEERVQLDALCYKYMRAHRTELDEINELFVRFKNQFDSALFASAPSSSS